MGNLSLKTGRASGRGKIERGHKGWWEYKVCMRERKEYRERWCWGRGIGTGLAKPRRLS